jgi:predicted MFS family arabinose efflux permease
MRAAPAPLCVSWIIVQWSWRAVFYTLLVPGLALALLVWIFVKDTPTASELKPIRPEPPAAPLGEMLKMPTVRWCAATIFFWSIAAWGR